jgi:cell wall-associated NlpC family hydrolase
MSNDSYKLRQLFGATLLASTVVTVCAANAPMRTWDLGHSSRRAESRVGPGVRSFELRRPTKQDSIVMVAWAMIGTPYERGGTSLQAGFDCSGLVRFVVSKVHLTLPRTAYQQALVGAPIGRDRLQPGDLLTFGRPDSVSHIGIYVGDGKFVHASSIAGRVIVSPLDRPVSRLIRPLNGARRLLAIADSLGRAGGG